MSQSAWGNNETQFFYNLTPEKILNSIEQSTGLHCTGRIMALNSMENRVYEIEIDLDEKPRNPSDAFLIAKFYRPGRWSKEQILEEHAFLRDLNENEIPAIAPIQFKDGETLHQMPDEGLYYTAFPKRGGRSPDELDTESVRQVGRLLARLHNVGSIKQAEHRIKLTPETYGHQNLAYLLEHKVVPANITDYYKTVVEEICKLSEPMFARTANQRIHGDCHFGNLISNPDGFFWVDFDDMVTGPCVQDLWLIIPGRDPHSKEMLEELVTSYEVMREFDRRSLQLIEPLRALRFVHFSAWIAKRWQDPAFQKAFPYFGSDKYWREQLVDLNEQLQLIQSSAGYYYS